MDLIWPSGDQTAPDCLLGWLPTLVETKHFADLFVRIAKRGIAALGGSTISQTECSRGNTGQQGRGHCKQYNRREPKLR
jgi:hypothetical protein